MEITKTKFRLLLLVYIIIVVLNGLSDIWTESVVPEIVKQLEPSLPPTESTLAWLLQGVFLFSSLFAGLLGFIGMFFFWSVGRYIYLIGVVLKIVIGLLMTSWIVNTGWEHFFGEVELFLDGVILTLCLYGPAKYLFIKKVEESQIRLKFFRKCLII